MSIFKSSLSSAEQNTRPTCFGIRMPIAGKRFTYAFVLAVFAWLMQLGTFWIPIITGNVHYGHGVCIKLAVLDTHENMADHQHHAHGNVHQHAHHHNHINHAGHENHASHLGHASYSTHQHVNNQSITTDKLFTHQADASESQPDTNSNSQHHSSCDICFLLASLAKLDIHTPLLEAVKTFTQKQQQRWFYQQQVLLTLIRILPPTRAPPIFS